MKHKNKERKSANRSLVIMLIGILAVALPFILNADMFQWGFGVATIGAILAITCFFVFLMFNGRAKVQERIFNKENILAHWQYSKEFWQEIYNEDMKDSGVGKIFGFFFGGIFALIGFIIFATDPDDNGLFLLVMLGIAVFFIIIGFISASAEKRRVKASLPEAIISQQGLFFKSILYTWNSPNISYLESVAIHPEESNTLLFVLRQLTGGGIGAIHYHLFKIAIPIPPGQEQSAMSIVQYFNLPLKAAEIEEIIEE